MQSGSLVTIGYVVFFILIFYFLLIRPQQKQKKQKQEMFSKLTVGDKIVTIGGLFGSVTKIKDDTVKIRLADNVEIEILKTAIGQVRNNNSEDK